jgi:hypothetical protein
MGFYESRIEIFTPKEGLTDPSFPSQTFLRSKKYVVGRVIMPIGLNAFFFVKFSFKPQLHSFLPRWGPSTGMR